MATESTQPNLKELIAEYQPQLKSFIRKRVASKEDAEDILQDVFYQLTKTVSTAMNPIEHVSAWLYKVARNTIINKGVKKQEEELPVYHNDEGNGEIMKDFSEILFGNKETAPSPETEYLRSLVWTELENALSELPPEQREIFELTELDDIPVKEIAQTTGIAVNTLLSRKHYAVLHLRKRLKELYEDIICA
jgi:RNA polymerase sigma factor (sigma-70 family)